MALIPTLGFGSASTLNNGLVAYWSLNETSGTRNDSVGSYHLTDNNTVGYDTGKNGNCASFVAGNTEYLSSAAASWDWTNGRTISVWVYPTVSGALMGLISKDNNGNQREWQLTMSGSGSNVITYWFQSDATYQSVTLTLTLDAWNHLLYWWDPSGDKKVYGQRNGGTPVASSSTLASLQTEASEPVYIGRYASGYYFTGRIDEPAIWNRVLTSDERAELYNGGTGKFYPY